MAIGIGSVEDEAVFGRSEKGLGNQQIAPNRSVRGVLWARTMIAQAADPLSCFNKAPAEEKCPFA
jgi:hypothetical protein